MTNKLFSRAWISPVTSITFLVVAVSGVILALHIKVGGNMKGLHEWLGYAFAVAGLVHLFVNWKAFVEYFRGRSATMAAVAALASIAISVAVLCTQPKQRPNQVVQLFDANADGVIDENEMAKAAMTLKALDANNDGKITSDELRPKPVNKDARP
ncbi:DUF4405 domain-containing protein [Geobacter sp. FeAm09]|uniref:DUF4405 domain-containing protein n=1 Tax=Geobacter sp. FeAm09 TaxID=2597769 RepID=UPI0011F05B6A|nr:DUF4405 domain-containing protein [Geobacter sp. FeAm09]QEM68514.1 DUF4405 domain-containing protein [Geobacter sp. FeAm09]